MSKHSKICFRFQNKQKYTHTSPDTRFSNIWIHTHSPTGNNILFKLNNIKLYNIKQKIIYWDFTIITRLPPSYSFFHTVPPN